MRLEFAEIDCVPKTRPIDTPARATGRVHGAWRLWSLLNHSTERIRGQNAILTEIGKIEERVSDERAAAKGRLGAELLENELFDRIVENSESSADARFIRTSREFGEPSLGPPRTPSDADPRSKSLVVCGSQAARYTLIAGEYQSQRKNGIVAIRSVLTAVAWSQPQCGCVLHG